MANSYTNYTGNGSTTIYPIVFPFLSTADVKVSVSGALVSPMSVAAGNVTLASAPAAAAPIRIFRSTPIAAPLVDFNDGSTLLESDLDTATRQSFYISQETTEGSLRTDIDGNHTAAGLRIKLVGAATTDTDALSKAALAASAIQVTNLKVAAAGTVIAQNGDGFVSVKSPTNSGQAISVLNAAGTIRSSLGLSPSLDGQLELRGIDGYNVLVQGDGTITSGHLSKQLFLTGTVKLSSPLILGGNKALCMSGDSVVSSTATSTDLAYLAGVTSGVQAQLNQRLTNISAYTPAGLVSASAVDAVQISVNSVYPFGQSTNTVTLLTAPVLQSAYSLLIFKNGLRLMPGVDYTYASPVVTFATAIVFNDKYSIIYWGINSGNAS